MRIELERSPSRLINQIRAPGAKPCVFIDEAQKVPALFDAVQVLSDNHGQHYRYSVVLFVRAKGFTQ